MELTTGQMIDTLQVGQLAIANDGRKTHVKRNELGFYWTFQNDKRSWRLLQIDSTTVNLKWTIIEEEN